MFPYGNQILGVKEKYVAAQSDLSVLQQERDSLNAKLDALIK